MASYRKLLGSTLLTLPHVRESKSYIVMEEVKETLALPIEGRNGSRESGLGNRDSRLTVTGPVSGLAG